jgi:Chalcone isomerase-like
MAAMAALVTMSAAAPGAVVEREGMRFDDAIRVAGSAVVLNGVGVRAAAWFKGYVAGLYLAQRSSDPDTIYALPGAKRIAVRMLIDVGPDLLAKTFGDGIRKNYRDDALEALRPRMELFDEEVRGIPGGVKKGQEIDLDFHPSTGTRVLVGGKAIGATIPGDDFYVALLKMFIGERAIDKGLRAAMLGG